jgi:hypothetical protein
MNSYRTASGSAGRCIPGVAVLTVGLDLCGGTTKAGRVVQQ